MISPQFHVGVCLKGGLGHIQVFRHLWHSSGGAGLCTCGPRREILWVSQPSLNGPGSSEQSLISNEHWLFPSFGDDNFLLWGITWLPVRIASPSPLRTWDKPSLWGKHWQECASEWPPQIYLPSFSSWEWWCGWAVWATCMHWQKPC